jgi:hypothetical protein
MIRIAIALTILVAVSPARGAEQEPEQSREKPGSSAETSAASAAANGALSPFSLSPLVPHAATGVALGGYDTAARSFRARGAVDGRIVSFLAARVEYDHGPGNGPSDRVSLGLRAKLLNQAAHGLELGVVAFYQPRDFREEGNVIGGVLLARRFDRFTLVANPLVGSDPEGDDQSFELRLAGLYRLGSELVIGLDSRGRYNLSDDAKRAGHSLIDWDAQAGLSLAYGAGPLLLSALLGPSLLQRSYMGADGTAGDREVKAGLLAMAGAGASF